MKVRIFLLVSLTAVLSAQNTGRLSGVVTDLTGAAVPEVRAELRMANGTATVAVTNSTRGGVYNFASLQPGLYDLHLEAPGFQRQTLRAVKVDPGKEVTLLPVRMELGVVTQVIEVTDAAQSIQTSNAENASSITNAQINRLPILDRNVINLIKTQVGVTDGRGPTVINGQRTSFANLTFDGINIQDNFIRSNALDFIPNRTFADQAAEVTIVTSNAGAMFPGGTAQVTVVSPSGTNALHGSAFWYNRNSYFSANDWFNNRDGLPNSFLNQNQFGGSAGGPIKKDKLLFFVNYEAFRRSQQASVNRTLLTADARQGIFTYRDAGGVVRKANVLQLAGVSVDPAMAAVLQRVPGPENINNFRLGDSSESLLRNTGGYSFLRRDNTNRDNVTGKLDYIYSARHTFAGTFSWNRDFVDRNDGTLANNYTVVPAVANDNANKLLSVAWRSTPSPRLTNELRGGFNLAPGRFVSSEQFGDALLGGLVFSNPVNTFRPQGRYTNTYSVQDNANYTTGAHTLYFGYQYQGIRVQYYDTDGTIPTYTLGIGTGNTGLISAQLPGIGTADLNAANNLLANLAGYVTSYSQTFNVTSRTSGFVNGAQLERNLISNNHAVYFQDNWKIRPRLTLNMGVRWDYYSPVDERDALALMPVVPQGKTPIDTLLSNSTLDFAGGAVGRPWHNTDRNNFGPNVGLAWDVFGNGRTAVRAGYSIGYVNDETIRAIDNNVVTTNRGLSAQSARAGLSGRVSVNRPAVAVPAYKVPRTFQDNYTLDSTSAFGIPDPNLRTPYVQQWSFGIQQEIKKAVVEVRYAANKVTKAYRAFDYNQVVIKENGFLEDFQRARSNGFLALGATGQFNPDYNPAISGSQRLIVFPQLASGGLLTNATVRNLIQQGQPGELGSVYQTNLLNGAVNFFRNPYALGTNMLTNYSNSSFQALQVDVRRRMAFGLEFQANYQYAKVLSDSLGDGQARFEAFLDKDNPKIERAPAPFDIRHQFKANAFYELPLGPGHAINSNARGMKYILGGWSFGTTIVWQGGTPFSVLSNRGTLNRGARSTNTNTAITTLSGDQLDDLFQLRMAGNGPYFVNASALGPDGRAVSSDGRAPYAGQAFFHPGPGELGSLQRRWFTGPSAFNLDFSIKKTTRINERHAIELRMDAFNAPNHPTWFISDQTIESVNFGRITSNFFDRRLIQFGLYYRF